MSKSGFLIKIFNKTGFRWLLSLLFSTISNIKYNSKSRIKYDSRDLMFKHTSKNGFYFFSPVPSWKYILSEFRKKTLNESCFHFTPIEGNVVVDIGAGIGKDSVIFSEMVANDGKVFAIEAHSKPLMCLEKMCEYNKLTNIFINHLAIGDENKMVKIGDKNNYTMNSLLSDRTAVSEVEMVTLDYFVEKNGIKKINLLKMDIEGAEKLVIKGMNKSVHIVENIAIATHDAIAEAINNNNFRTKDIIIEFLMNNGFEILKNPNSFKWDEWVYGKKTNAKNRQNKNDFKS